MGGGDERRKGETGAVTFLDFSSTDYCCSLPHSLYTSHSSFLHRLSRRAFRLLQDVKCQLERTLGEGEN